MEYIQGVPRDQVILFPEIVDEYVEEENPVRVIDAFVNRLNLENLGFAHARVKECGRPVCYRQAPDLRPHEQHPLIQSS